MSVLDGWARVIRIAEALGYLEVALMLLVGILVVLVIVV